MLTLNLKSMYLCSRAVIPHMIEAGGGSIVSTSSAPALTGNSSGTHAYIAAKGGVVALGRLIAHTWGRQGIRSNVILPGITDSHMSDRIEQAAARSTALGRIGRVDEVAKVALFFASDDSSYVTGETVFIDGGAHVWRPAQPG
jgi:3-oxoacyl-[acyl-carrier protein] reductase